MSVLKLKQTTDTGASKVFKLDSKTALRTFGSSRKADLVSIDPNAEKFVGAFEYRYDGWHYISFDIKNKTPDLKIESEMSLQIKNSSFQFSVHETKEHLYNDFNDLKTTGSIEKQIYVVSSNNRILETKVIDKNLGFLFAIHGKKNIFKLAATADWVTEIHAGFEIKSKIVNVDSVTHLEESKNMALSAKEKKTVK